jgi:hypothetical protein
LISTGDVKLTNKESGSSYIGTRVYDLGIEDFYGYDKWIDKVDI